MKTSAVLASLLFGSYAVAAPVDKRDLVYTTEIVTETVVVFTTVYEDGAGVPQATTTPAGYFYEQPKSAIASPSLQAPANAAPLPEQNPSSVKVEPAIQAPTPTPVVEQPNPAQSSAYVAPPPAASSVASPPAASSVVTGPATPTNTPVGGGSTGETFTGEITIYEPNGHEGACGPKLSNEEFVVALSKEAWGESTYELSTGKATNKWCGQPITAFFQGRQVDAVIMDLCPECKGYDIDLAPAAWRQLTGSDEKTRYKGATWTMRPKPGA